MCAPDSSPTRLTTTTCSIEGVSRQRLVDIFLERHDGTAPVTAVGGDEHFGLSIVDAVAQRLRAKSAEHHAVRRADAIAGVHGDHQLGNHAHVKADAIALLDTEFLQYVGKLVDFAPDIAIGQHALIARLAFPDDRRFVLATRLDVAIQAIIGSIELAADEPLRPRRVPLQNFFPRLEPMKLFGGLGPEGLRIFARGVEYAGAFHIGVFFEFLGGRKISLLVEQNFDRFVCHGARLLKKCCGMPKAFRILFEHQLVGKSQAGKASRVPACRVL